MTVTRARIVALITFAVALGGGSLALAQSNPPHTLSVTGDIAGEPVNVMQRLCVGVEGPYLELRGHFSGAITSSDPRLTGTLDFMAEQALVSLVTGLGTFKGRFQISDASGAQTAQGQFFTVVTDGGLNHGFALGKVMGGSDGAADDFFARFQSTLDASLHVAGHFGDFGDVRLPAVVQGGQCSGKWTRVP
jgi:hypothetical protein